MNLEERVARKYLQLLSSAKARGIEFDLNLATVRNLLKAKKCRYTGVSLTFEENKSNQLTIDRVDNSKGYVVGNVVACSKSFNERKGSVTETDIELIYKVLKSRR